MSIIDSHVHLYPDELVRDPEAWAKGRSEDHWHRLTSPRPDGRTIQGWADVARLLRDMDKAGVERSVLLGWYWERAETCAWQNRWHVRCVRSYPDRFIGFAAVQPAESKASLEEVRRAAGEGLVGLGELSPHAQGYGVRDEAWLETVGLAQELGLVINLHVSEPVGRAYPGKVPTPLEDFQWLVARFPEVTFILAHWGGLLPFYELNPRVRREFKKVYYDTAASPLIYSPRIFRAVIDAVGAEKILFGSDYPLLLYPRHSREPEMRRFVEEVRSAGLTQQERDAIMGGNARRLFLSRETENARREG